MHDSKALQRFSLVEPNIISSTYIWTISISLSTCLVNKVVSTLPLTKPSERRNVESLSYQALGACFKPYKVLSNLKTKSECVGSVGPVAFHSSFDDD